MRIFLTLLTAFLLLPTTGHAYLTPEDVLYGNTGTVDAPPNARGARAARAAQEAEYDARREQDDVDSAPAEEPEEESMEEPDEVLHGAPPAEEESALTPEEMRVLERMRDNDSVILSAPGTEVLHGGAPLADTGPETIIAMLLGACAIGWTLRMAMAK